MAFWIFKCNPEKYRLAERLADPNPTLTWTVSRYREGHRSRRERLPLLELLLRPRPEPSQP